MDLKTWVTGLLMKTGADGKKRYRKRDSEKALGKKKDGNPPNKEFHDEY